MKKFICILILLLTGVGLYAETLKPLQPVTLKGMMQQVDQVKQKSNTRAAKQKTVVSPETTMQEVTVQEIQVTGNRHVDRVLILNEISIRPGDKVNDYHLSRNVKNILSLGLFQDVKTRYVKKRGKTILVFDILENPIVSDIQFQGNTVVDTTQLLKALETKQGDILNLITLRKDIRNIEAQYREQDCSQAKVYYVKVPESVKEPLVFMIAEGVIEAIEVTGNKKTQAYVILREMDLKQGMVLKDSQLKEDLRRIFNLNYFTNLQPDFEPGVSPNAYKLVLNIEERASNAAVSFGGGYSPIMGASIFSDFYWDNLFGTGQTVMLKGQFGRATTYQLKYHNPWMWDVRKSFTLRTWLTDGGIGAVNPLQGNEIMFRNERRKGIDVALGWPFSYEFRSSHKLKYESVALIDSNKAYKIHSYTLDLSHDTRDVWFNPWQGHEYLLSVEKGLILDRLSLDFTRYFLGFHQFMPTREKQTIAMRLDFDYLASPMISDPDIFYSQMYIVGGSTTVRGYDDLSPFAYGNKRVVASLEYRLLFNDIFQGIGFVDAGYATSGSDMFNLKKYRMGKGLGIRFLIPGLGPLRLDFGIDDLGVGRLHFNIGHSF